MVRKISNQEFDDIFIKYSDMVTRLCILNLRNTTDAKDCFQNVFIKLFQSEKDFENDEHIKAWLIRVTLNECKNYQKLFYKPMINIDEVIVVKKQEELVLLPVVLKLLLKYKNVLYLHYYEGYKTSEIASMLNMNENTIKSHLKRGRELLRKEVGELYE
ncbi:MAG: RNA polymerase sigma factor [Longibaculum sp.]